MADDSKLSGSQWCKKFPGSKELADLEGSFKTNATAFYNAMLNADPKIDADIKATSRPDERQYLMHWAWQIAKEKKDPNEATKWPGVDIDWVHKDAKGEVDLEASRKAAQEMIDEYRQNGYAAPPKKSKHGQGLAVDMVIKMPNVDVKIKNKDGVETVIKAGGKSDGMNEELIAFAEKEYKVFKLRKAGEEQHWSDDGS